MSLVAHELKVLMPTPLPRSIQYLKPVFENLSRLEPEDVNEGLDTTDLCVVLKTRIEGLAKGDAVARLVRDREELDGWLEKNPDDSGHFVSAFMLEADELASYLKGFKPPKGWRPQASQGRKRKRRVMMQIPPGFRSWRDGPGICMEKGEHVFMVGPIGRPSMRQLVDLMKQQDMGVEVLPASFGAAVGYRCVADGVTRSYLLRAGSDEFTVTVRGDAALIEPYLSTLRCADVEG